MTSSRKTSSWTLMVMATVVGLILIVTTNATGNEIYEQRGVKSSNGDKRPFFVGSRYGRSQSDTSMDENGKPLSRIVPRNDRFFFGSRYGKRSLTTLDDDPAYNSKKQTSNSGECQWTGFANLFRC